MKRTPVLIVIAAAACAQPIANIIEAVLKLLAGNGCSIAPVFPARSHLAQGVIGVNPIRAIGQRRTRALVGAVVGVTFL